ncbi:lysylphosphatidylglycerol synthase domain-containing protein [Novosphingobium lentum]|uniref:lysylphosphatidylglycerol synthase domain-containing protein n=1 Tax=Novosphingobium lentum TaxID=145287 RepID=UPI0009FFDD70|nr:lysylphosphatidylglycerol synthase domain-containing protein [Novosphingobium lentum]
MTDPVGRRGTRWAALWIMTMLVLLVVAIASSDTRRLLGEAADNIRLSAVMATLPGQLAATLLCAAALWALRPGVSFAASLGSRLLRDAGGNLLVFMPGLGEIIGARALVLGGGRTRAAVTASVLDTLAETLAQVPYGVLAVLVLPRLWRRATAADLPLFGIASVLIGLAAMALLAVLLSRNTQSAAGRLRQRIEAELALLRAEIGRQRTGLPAAVALHFVAWAMGGVQLWMAGSAMGLPLTLFAALVMESAAYAGRAVLFFIPAGLAVQEAGLIVAGLAYGLTPAQSLALGLVLRLRDLLFGLPLLAWPLYEFRHRRRAGA